MRQPRLGRTYGVGVVGIGFGRQVLIPAFRRHSKCRVLGVAASQLARAQSVASAEGIELAFGDWKQLVEHPSIDIVAIAVPPKIQPEILRYAAQCDKAVFAEKPAAGNIHDARMLESFVDSREPILVDFMFPNLETWKKARTMLEAKMIGELQQVAVSWHVETFAQRTLIQNWKSQAEFSGGALNTFGSHVFYNLEYFAGSIAEVTAHLHSDPNQADHAFDALINFESKVTATVTVSTRSPGALGHRIEFFGSAGMLILENQSEDYVAGFSLHQKKLSKLKLIQRELKLRTDGRLAPVFDNVSALVDCMEGKPSTFPDLADALRVEELLDLARRQPNDSSNRHPHPGLQRGRKHPLSA